MGCCFPQKDFKQDGGGKHRNSLGVTKHPPQLGAFLGQILRAGPGRPPPCVVCHRRSCLWQNPPVTGIDDLFPPRALVGSLPDSSGTPFYKLTGLIQLLNGGTYAMNCGNAGRPL